MPGLVSALVRHGDDITVGPHIAGAIGVNPEATAKSQEIESPSDGSARGCYVILDKSSGERKPNCVFFVHRSTSERERVSRYFRMTTDGQLEKAIVIRGKYGVDGKPVKGSGSKVDEDINSPEVQKAFQAERAYWLKDWLKKQEKGAAKK